MAAVPANAVARPASRARAEGLWNDVARKFVDDFLADEQACRRPSWFSYRRVALLLSEADEVELVHAGTSAFVVRLVASTRFSLGAFYARRQAYVLWVDQIDAREDWSFSFEGSTRWRQVSLVPTVEPPLGSPPVQNGYAAGEDVDWSPERTCTASVSSTSSGVAAVLHPADPKENPAPLCIFTDAELTGISAGGIPPESSSTTEGRWWAL